MAKTVSNICVGVATLYVHDTAGTAAGSITDEVGYTEDGVNFEYNPTVADIDVEEDTFPVERVITKEEVSVTCNMAEASLANLDNTIAGSILAGAVITIGGGTMQEKAIKVVGEAPSGATRTIYMPYVNPVGVVGQSYRKDNKTIVPVTFKAFRNADGATICTIMDS